MSNRKIIIDKSNKTPGNISKYKSGYKVELYWLPLGAGTHIVRLSGKIYELFSAGFKRRKRMDLFHAALQIHTPEFKYVIEQAPVVNSHGKNRGVVAEGPVGMNFLGNSKFFRYEVRCWKNGIIPDIDMAVGEPILVTKNPVHAKAILKNIKFTPTPIWGRDELKTGEMWNSNSIISWVLAKSGIDARHIKPPYGGRAPGWNAGLVMSQKDI